MKKQESNGGLNIEEEEMLSKYRDSRELAKKRVQNFRFKNKQDEILRNN